MVPNELSTPPPEFDVVLFPEIVELTIIVVPLLLLKIPPPPPVSVVLLAIKQLMIAVEPARAATPAP